MSFKEQVEKWFAKFKPYLFSYKNGFFELPYIANSPQLMIAGFIKMPFVKHNAKQNLIITKTPFVNVELHYQQIEEGLFVIYSQTNFKANVSFKGYCNKSAKADYYCLSFSIDHLPNKSNTIIEGVNFNDNAWLLRKPLAITTDNNIKGSVGKFFCLHFTEAWLKNFLKKQPKEDVVGLNLFLKSQSGFLICPHTRDNAIKYNYKAFLNLITQKEKNGSAYLNALKREACNFVTFFSLKMRAENVTADHFKISNLERIKVLQAEQILQSHLYKKFPGIEFIAGQVGFSETKLKECFKLVYNNTLFQYFQAMQMNAAKELIATSNLKIADVAATFSYENAGKFSAAFKEHFNVLPSEV